MDSKRNRLGVCCLQRRPSLNTLLNRRRIRQDDIQVTWNYTDTIISFMIHFQINDDGILELQTLPQDEASDDEVFINQELLDTIFSSAEDAADGDTEQTIEDIIQEVESTGDVTPAVIMVKDAGVSGGGDVVLRLPEEGQGGDGDSGLGGGPIVVINIRCPPCVNLVHFIESMLCKKF